MKRLILSVILLIVMQLSFGQVGFDESYIYDSSILPYNHQVVTSGDLDGDNDMDVITVSEINNQYEVIWFENLDGLGDFGLPKSIGAIDYIPFELAIADLDGDGDLDVISPKAWYRNIDGLGAFELVNFTLVPSNFETVNTADFDGDGDLDILLSRIWLENSDGLGTMILGQDFFDLTGGIQNTFPGDLDGDGDIDIALGTSSDDEIFWYENSDGLGGFGGSQLIGSNSYGHLRFLKLADIDNDNDLDVVSAAIFGGAIKYHKNNGTASVWTEETVFYENPDDDPLRGNYQSLNVKDIDNDGDIDISVSFDDTNYSWFENTDSNGTFVEHLTPTSTSRSAINVDIDGDDDLDVVAISFCSAELVWDKFPYISQVEPERHNISIFDGGLTDLFFEDLNMDGVIDVITTSSTSCFGVQRSFVVLHKNIDNFNTISKIKRIIEFDSKKDRFSFEDIDNDGDPDLIVLDRVNDKIEFYFNGGNGAFVFNSFVSVDYVPSSLFTTAFYLEDLDNDSYLDLITLNFGSIVWYKNSNGVFGTPSIITSGNYKTVASHDFDSDGDNDILYVKDYEVFWVENTNSNGSFGIPQLISNINTTDKLIVGEDIDGDQDIDIAAYSEDDNSIVLLKNLDGAGNFSSPIELVDNVLNANMIIASLKTARIDEDNNPDIILSTSLTNAEVESLANVFWYENLGMDQFSDQKEFISGFNSRLIDVFDYDYDGDNDVVSKTTNDIVLCKNLGFLGNEIDGEVRFDADLNGCDSSDLPLNNIIVISSNGNDTFAAFTQADGSFQYPVNLGTFTTSLSGLSNHVDVSPEDYVTSFTTNNNGVTLNFCVSPNTLANNLSISVYPISNDPRPGFNTSYQLVYRNMGTTQLSGNVTFEYDDTKLQFLIASETVSSQTSNTLSFNFSGLNPFEVRTINLGFNVFEPPVVNIDDTIASIATINPVFGDETEEDNVFQLQQTVIGSYDPNDITVLEGEQIFIQDADKYLHYLIRFQNIGTASAINVRVENELDDKLDWTTIQLESLSHSGRVEIFNGRDVSFVFDNINLPDSTSDEPNSHGFISYKIKPKTDVVVGDIFYNSAEIYFDFNLPIITNTVFTEIDDTLSIEEFQNDLFLVFPNPTNSKLNIQSKVDINDISIVDINGRLLKSIDVNDETQEYTIDVENLSDGIYFLKIQAENSEQVIRFVKN